MMVELCVGSVFSLLGNYIPPTTTTGGILSSQYWFPRKKNSCKITQNQLLVWLEFFVCPCVAGLGPCDRQTPRRRTNTYFTDQIMLVRARLRSRPEGSVVAVGGRWISGGVRFWTSVSSPLCCSVRTAVAVDLTHKECRKQIKVDALGRFLEKGFTEKPFTRCKLVIFIGCRCLVEDCNSGNALCRHTWYGFIHLYRASPNSSARMCQCANDYRLLSNRVASITSALLSLQSRAFFKSINDAALVWPSVG